MVFIVRLVTFYSNPNPRVHNDGKWIPILPMAYPVEKKHYALTRRNVTFSCFLLSLKSSRRLWLGAISTAGARLWAAGQQVDVKSSLSSSPRSRRPSQWLPAGPSCCGEAWQPWALSSCPRLGPRPPRPPRAGGTVVAFRLWAALPARAPPSWALIGLGFEIWCRFGYLTERRRLIFW